MLTINYSEGDTPEMKARFEKGALYRGQIINEFSQIEFIIETIIAEYFAYEDKLNEFIHIVCHSLILSFDNKREILLFMANTKYRSIILIDFKTFEKFKEELNALMKIRNAVAHMKILISENERTSFDGGNVRIENFEFKNYESVSKGLILNKVAIQEYGLRAFKIKIVLGKILEIVRGENAIRNPTL